jgi:phage terminase small subunit
MPRGGYRPGAGRPKGSGNASKSEADSDGGESPTWELPVAYMLRVMNDPTTDAARRDRLAIALAPYLHRKQGERGAREIRADVAEEGTDWDGLLN